MGLMCSWIAVRGAAKSELLEALALVETGEQVEPWSGVSRMSCMERAGWVILFSNDLEWADRQRVLDLSSFGFTLGCQFEDKVAMMSVVCVAEHGQELWRVYHINEPKACRLEVTGDPPPEFQAIRDRLVREQDAAGDSGADCMYELPLELARAVCGYRSDEDEADTLFQALRRVREKVYSDDDLPKDEDSIGWLRRLFVRFLEPWSRL